MNLLDASFKVGRLFGINIRVHILFVVWIAYRLWSAAGRGLDWQFEAMFFAMLFGIVLVHEFGHCIGARAVGGDAHNILMWPLGGLAFAYAPMRPWPQFVTVACGPLVNLVFCVVSALVFGLYAGYWAAVSPNPLSGVGPPALLDYWLYVVWIFYKVNLFLLAFNLLPIYPFDGGQLFQAIIWPFVGINRASLIASKVGLVGAVLLAFWSFTLPAGNLLLFIAIFGGFTSWQRYQAARAGRFMEDSRYETYGPSYDPRPWWQRLFKIRPRWPSPPDDGPYARSAPSNPNPGGWDARQQALREEEAELDRLLKKVSERGTSSLSYVERQRLERITRKRREEDQKAYRDLR